MAPLIPLCTALTEHEQLWASYQPFLEEQGYMLRPRYKPGWVAACLSNKEQDPFCFEDSVPGSPRVLDAKCMSDGADVVVKVVPTSSMEVCIAMFLTNCPDAEKHSLPCLDLIPMPDNPHDSFMVFPRMRSCTCFPYINTVQEFIEFLQQMLEGLVFLHDNNIAHRAISQNHMVLNASRMIPGGFHFAKPRTSDGVTYLLHRTGNQSVPHWKTRTEAGPMQYYFIDFGLSVQFPSRDARKLVTGVCGQHDLIPEVSDTVPYDPFKVDVWSIGGIIVDYLEVRYAGLDYLVPLARKLRHRDPTRRLDAQDALKLFQR
ncbi:kinase-like domain-containing protein [Mycena metata]|uniref:Kinase-like domain-containing protein n=1 Tax=Mycena metata TaxID=1033252 RepID=A0AAD7HN30_9AGAR|nr:kinase-like domain-containing protein [Mycena metata]